MLVLLVMSTSTCHFNWFSYVYITVVLKVYYITRYYIMNENTHERRYRKCMEIQLHYWLTKKLHRQYHNYIHILLWKLIASVAMKVYSLKVQLRRGVGNLILLANKIILSYILLLCTIEHVHPPGYETSHVSPLISMKS